MIRDRLNLTDQQITDALDYIATHQTEVETEYQNHHELSMDLLLFARWKHLRGLG